MPMSSHDSLHQFAALRLKTYTLARKERELLVACRPPRGLTPRGWSWFPAPPPVGVGGVVVDGWECWLMES